MTTRQNLILLDLAADKILTILKAIEGEGIRWTTQEVTATSRKVRTRTTKGGIARGAPGNRGATHELILQLIADGPKPLAKIKAAFKDEGFSVNSASSAISQLKATDSLVYEDGVARLP